MPSTPSPLRNDLVVIPQDTANGTVYVVKDPVNRRFFRFKEVEHHIAQLLDGERTDDQIRRDVETKFDAPLEQKTLDAFIAQLEEHGLLDKGGPIVEKDRPIWNAKNPYSVRMHLFDPDRLLDRMIVPLRFMFTPAFVVAAALIIAWAGVSTFLDWGAMTADLRHIGLLSAVLLAWPTVILVGVLHEFAHGLTCKYFGGEVRDMGFLLIYYHPALYCNVSDTWLFPEKWKRLCVMFAGTFLELLLWALATITWRFTEVGTLPNALALVVVATSGAKIFLNFNPLIKLDGY